MTFTESVRTCLRKYVTFSGRASRSEYWWFFLFTFLLSVVAAVIDWQFFTSVVSMQSDTGTAMSAQSNQPVQSIVSLLVFLPQLAAAWRRMHDSGRSGFYALFPLILMLGAVGVLFFGIGLAGSFTHGGSLDILFTRATLLIVIPTLIVLLISPLLVLWWLTRPSQPGANKYGPNPNEVSG